MRLQPANRFSLLDAARRSLAAMLLLVVLPGGAPARMGPSERPTITLHVSVDASPGGDGTAERPFRRITDAVGLAVRNKRQGYDTRVEIGPGVYREGPIEFGYSNHPSNDPDNEHRIEVVATIPGSAVVSGSDVAAGWIDVGNGVYAHEWNYTWGPAENPWEGDVELPEIVRRRELVFVDGVLQRQRLRDEALEPGSFKVDEAGGRILLYPPEGVNVQSALVEIGVRELLWDQNHEDNVAMVGLVFQHAVTPWDVGKAAVRISASDDITVQDCRFEWTNWTGLYIGESRSVRLTDVVLNNNGGQGWSMFRVSDVRAANTETSWNNWRGEWGGFTGWSIGNKILSAHRLRLTNHKAVGNASRGLWLDYDVSDAVVDGAELSENDRDGIWIEASQGPVTVRRSRIERNLEAGVHGTYSQNVTLDANRIAGNRLSQIRLGGTGTRRVVDFETGEDQNLDLARWVVTGNTFDGSIVHTETMRRSDWARFVNTFVSEQNEFVATSGESLANETFQIVGQKMGIEKWRQVTGQDKRSTRGDSR